MSDRLFRALLNVVATDQGGRQTPFVNGYRPQFYLPNALSTTSFMIQKIESGDQVAPGEAGTVQAFLLFPDSLGVPVPEGTEFELREGYKVVARGVIQEYL